MRCTEIELASEPRVLCRKDNDWPSSLKKLKKHQPQSLRVAGNLPSCERAVAIVGTRHASDEALAFSEKLAFDLAKVGCVIVSGGAFGIDAAAHRGALQAGGVTVAVLATGFKKPYPPHHGPLFSDIAKHGALITEATDEQTPWPGLFLARNRLIAALSKTVVVIEAPHKSGALSTATWAKNIGIIVFSVPSAPWNKRASGSLSLLKDGARICISAQDVLTIAAIAPNKPPTPALGQKLDIKPGQNFTIGFDNPGQVLLRQFDEGIWNIDDLVQKTGYTAAVVQTTLLQLRLGALVEECAGGRYRKAISNSQ